jgi:hypothetical protein
MLASSPMEAVRQECRAGVAVLCVLFGLWLFVPFAGAQLIETCCGSGGSMVGATAAAWGASDRITVVMATRDILAMAETPNGGAQAMAETRAEGDSIARERRRRPGQLPPLPSRPRPGQRPKPSPVR